MSTASSLRNRVQRHNFYPKIAVAKDVKIRVKAADSLAMTSATSPVTNKKKNQFSTKYCSIDSLTKLGGGEILMPYWRKLGTGNSRGPNLRRAQDQPVEIIRNSARYDNENVNWIT